MSGPQRKLLLLALLLVAGFAALIGLYGPLHALTGSSLGFAALIAGAIAWVSACVALGVTAAIEAGLMRQDKPIVLATPPDPEPVQPPRTRPHGSDGPVGPHIDQCPGCPPILVVPPGNRPVRMWQCQARFGMPPY